jgi:hypothetical protein
MHRKNLTPSKVEVPRLRGDHNLDYSEPERLTLTHRELPDYYEWHYAVYRTSQSSPP